MQIPKDKVRFIDRPEIPETFADSIQAATFDGNTFRIELCVTRLDEPKPPAAPTGRRYPVCRLVLTPQTMIDFFNQLQQFVNVMQKQGVLKKIDPPPTATKQ